MKNSINTGNGEPSLLVCGASLFSHLLLDQQKDEYRCSFVEADPRLVAIRCFLQLVVILLRLVVVVAVAAADAVFIAAATVAATTAVHHHRHLLFHLFLIHILSPLDQ